MLVAGAWAKRVTAVAMKQPTAARVVFIVARKSGTRALSSPRQCRRRKTFPMAKEQDSYGSIQDIPGQGWVCCNETAGK